ncbi:MAG: hypothetical protein ACJ780_04620 [Solirubrobacteraceae bacterium]
MKSKRLWVVLAAALGAAGAGASSVLATPQSGLTTTTVATASFPPLRIHSDYQPSPPGPLASRWQAMLKTHGITDVYVVDNVLAPGGMTGYHDHLGPSLIMVVRGTVTNYRAEAGNCAGVDYPKGTGFIDAGGGDIHELKNNGTETAETIAVQLIPHGQPRKIDVLQTPPGCPA